MTIHKLLLFPSRDFLNRYQYFLNVLAENVPVFTLHTTCSLHHNGDSVSTRFMSHLSDGIISYSLTGTYIGVHNICYKQETNKVTEEEQKQ